MQPPQQTPPPLNDLIDPITALQDNIDGLSLAMFEALRGLRDAVAPADSAANRQQSPSHSQAAATWDSTATSSNIDIALVEELAAKLIQQSAQLEEQIKTSIPGMHRTRTEQMAYIENVLIPQNEKAKEQLQEAYAKAMKQRNSCRKFLLDSTEKALNL